MTEFDGLSDAEEIEKAKIVAVLARHTHFVSAGEIAPDVMQYISSQGITGNINRYEIGE